jgi:uncharacterized membrane protein affecting hemolysin expression
MVSDKPEEDVNLSSLQIARIVWLICLPLLASSALSIWIILNLISESESRQSQVIGKAIAAQLAASVSEYLVSEDRLSLTVLLSDLVQEGIFSKATIYGADDRLVATAGEHESEHSHVYTAEIPYQDSIAGYVRITLSEDRLFTDYSKTLFWLVLLNLILLLGTGFYAKRIANRMTHPIHESASSQNRDSTTETKGREPGFSLPIIKASSRFDRKVVPVEDNFTEFTVLALKLRPARLIEELRTNIKQVISLYKGQIESFDDDEITVLFTKQDDHCFQSICTALVIQSLAREFDFADYKAGVVCGSERTEVQQVRKKASYFASVAQNELLVSDSVYLFKEISELVKISEFHGAMSPDSQLYRIEGLIDTHQRLIDSQARQLTGNEAQ